MTEPRRLQEWIANKANHSWRIFIKRLSANDTGASGGHQAGIYIPAMVMKECFPEIQTFKTLNPSKEFPAKVDSHDSNEHILRAIYYNSKKFGSGTRNEQRITRWATGYKDTPLQNKEMTGSLCVFAFYVDKTGQDASYLNTWCCNDSHEEDYIESIVGEAIPKIILFGRGDEVFTGLRKNVDSIWDFPEPWKLSFPTGKEIFDFALSRFNLIGLNPDERIVRRRVFEFNIFKVVEDFHYLSSVQKKINSVEDFIQVANSIANRRKSRSGSSLENHIERIFIEEKFYSFGKQCRTEQNKKPDFLFPSCESYHDTSFDINKLNMLAVKTTCKDRWRQILNESKKIKRPYLFTLQEGVSINQFNEMKSEGVRLVVPMSSHASYPISIRSELITLSNFINQMKVIYSEC